MCWCSRTTQLIPTSLLSLLINPAVHTHTPLSALQPVLSFISFFPTGLPFPLLFFFMMNIPATTNHTFGKNTQRGQEPRIKGWGLMVWGVCFCFKCLYACVLLFDQCWQSLTSFMHTQLSCFPSLFHLCLSLALFFYLPKSSPTFSTPLTGPGQNN